jgi:hypothetical protein
MQQRISSNPLSSLEIDKQWTERTATWAGGQDLRIPRATNPTEETTKSREKTLEAQQRTDRLNESAKHPICNRVLSHVQVSSLERYHNQLWDLSEM